MIRSGAPHVAEHGGDLAAIALRYGVRKESLVDFSANVNPLGPPASLVREFARAARDRRELARYPDASHAGLVRALARKHDVDPNSIVIGNGAAALIDAAVRVRRLERCLVPEPAFSENRRALAAAGSAVVSFPLRSYDGFRLDARAAIATMRGEACDACLITNPHNPSGALTSRDEMLTIVRAARESGALAIFDEAFIDYARAESVAAIATREPALIVIRSLTKFFAVPALRVGYALCEPSLAERLRAVLAPWPVVPAAARAFVAALADRGYERRTLAHNERERERLARKLRRIGLSVTESAANFLLLQLPEEAPSATALVHDLIVSDGLVVRDCSRYPGIENGRFLRVAVLDRRRNDRLIRAIDRSQGNPPNNGSPADK